MTFNNQTPYDLRKYLRENRCRQCGGTGNDYNMPSCDIDYTKWTCTRCDGNGWDDGVDRNIMTIYHAPPRPKNVEVEDVVLADELADDNEGEG